MNKISTKDTLSESPRFGLKVFLPYLSLAGGVLALSLSALFIRAAQAPSTVTTFYRMTFAS
ncbi:MAG: hypothetical protein LWX83_18935, partial [Anaerolineae bacterium]|nr:hypothetical protein [Anaerolineae bacterium]